MLWWHKSVTLLGGTIINISIRICTYSGVKETGDKELPAVGMSDDARSHDQLLRVICALRRCTVRRVNDANNTCQAICHRLPLGVPSTPQHTQPPKTPHPPQAEPGSEFFPSPHQPSIPPGSEAICRAQSTSLSQPEGLLTGAAACRRWGTVCATATAAMEAAWLRHSSFIFLRSAGASSYQRW